MASEDGFTPELIDLHLGRLKLPEADEVRARLAGSADLTRADADLTKIIASLRGWTAPPAPEGLKARIAARVSAAGAPPRVLRPADDLTEKLERDSGRIIKLSNLREIVAVAAMIVLMVGIGVPSLLNMRERAVRMGCSQNLALLGQGVQSYAATYASSVPFTGWGSQRSWLASDDPAVVTVPNRRHLYPLLAGAFIRDPRLFVCSGRRDVPMPADQVQQHDDFLESRNVSYAYQNMAGVRPSSNDNPQLPILADDNPLFKDGMPLLDVRRLRWRDLTQANSGAHGGAGQNVLTLSGTVRWVTTPMAGVNDDNIWTLRGVDEYHGSEGPQAATDSHLIK